jgi:hypothetical protein
MAHPAQALSIMPTVLSLNGMFNDLGRGDFINPLGTVYGMPLRYQVSEDLVKTWRDHKFGGGANFEVIRWDMWQYSPNVIGRLNPQTLDAFFQGGVDPAQLLEEMGDAKLRVFVIWEPVLPTDLGAPSTATLRRALASGW